MKKKIFGFLLALSVLSSAGYIYISKEVSRNPANKTDSFFSNLEIVSNSGTYRAHIKNESVCADGGSIEYKLKASGLADFGHQSADEDQSIYMNVTASCPGALEAIIFDERILCGSENQNTWSIKKSDFKLSKYPGFFPRAWFIESVHLISRDGVVSMKSPVSEGLSFDYFSVGCD